MFKTGNWHRISWKMLSLLVVFTMLLPNFAFVIQEAQIVSLEISSASAASLKQNENFLRDETEVTEFASLVNRASQIRAFEN
jgi:hypothetical protein